MVMYRSQREDEVLYGRVALIGDDIQSEEVTIEAHGVWRLSRWLLGILLQCVALKVLY
jgi:hypothetical protein